MSSEKGNIKRSRAQKYQNIRAFKNDLYDKTVKTKFLNTLDITDVCIHCKGILEWRIKFKKYKIAKGAKTCVKCNKKNVFLSYRTLCSGCAQSLKVCPKCGKNETEIVSTKLEPVISIGDESKTDEESGEDCSDGG